MDWFKGKKVFVTGHTGFKGTWLCKMLINAGAIVTGYSLNPPTEPNLFELSMIKNHMNSVIGDIRDYNYLKHIFDDFQPEIVFHLAAQPIVIDSYKDPKYTYETNVIGTVNILECIRLNDCVKSFVNITTDKVYLNREWCWGYREDEMLDGFDPYSNSKSCSELVTHCYINSFFTDRKVSISTARAGNVIGGGDFANNRIIPDCIRAIQDGTVIKVRNRHSIRPYQHVLEALGAYLMIAKEQYMDYNKSGYYNIGPDECDCISTGELVDTFCKIWGDGVTWLDCSNPNAVHEATFLKLDCSKIKSVFNWKPRWHINNCLELVCQFNKVWLSGKDVSVEMDKEINEFLRRK